MDFDIAKLLANPSFLYAMGGLGSAMSGKENPAGQALGGIAMEGAKSEQQWKLIKSLLGMGGDVKLDKDNVKMNLPTGAFTTGNADSLASGLGSQGAVGTPAPTPTTPATPMAGGSPGAGNPYPGSSSFLDRPFSLMGLSPDDIKGAFQLKLMQDEIERKKVADIGVNAYHKELAETLGIQRRATAAKAGIPPDTRTNDIKEYEYAVETGAFVGKFPAWMEMKKEGGTPAEIKEYQKAVDQGYTGKFIEYKKELAQASKLTVDEEATRAQAVGAAKNALYPKSQALLDDLNKYRGSKVFYQDADQYNPKRQDLTPDQNERLGQTKAMIEQIRKGIIGSGYKIIGDVRTGPKGSGTVYFEVERNGKRETFEYGIR